MIRAVLDPGVLIAAVVSPRGVCAGLLRRWDAGEFDLIVSEQVLDEFSRVLARPKFSSAVTVEEVRAMVTRLRSRAFLVEDPPGPERVSRDPHDDYRIALARAAEADVLVSGDRDLTELRIAPSVVPPGTFARALDRRS